MNFFELFAIAFGLSMDALAVSICKGLAAGQLKARSCILTGLYFGSFQALMPLTGYLLGSGFSDPVKEADHWIVFLLLSVIGGKMILDALRGDDRLDASFSFRAMLPLSVATSIDALAVGAGFALLRIDILFVSVVIGMITMLLCASGVKLGNLFGSRFRAPAQLTGGLILILMGIKTLLEHLNQA